MGAALCRAICKRQSEDGDALDASNAKVPGEHTLSDLEVVPAPGSVEPDETTPLVPDPAPESNAVAPTEATARLEEIPENTLVYSGLPGIGSFIEVYSISSQAWCPGVIHDMDSCSAFVAYRVPSEPSDMYSVYSIRIKTLPLDSTDLRVATDTGAWLGAEVEVFSHSMQYWCPGKINVIRDGAAEIAIKYPDQEDEVIKHLQLGDKEIQLPAAMEAVRFSTGADGFAVGCPVEVYSNSIAMWCNGEVHDIKEGMATIAFYYPGMEPQNEAPALKDLPLGHPDIRLPTTASSIPAFANPGVPESELLPGVAVELFSESRQSWISGTVAEVKDGMATVTVCYPDMPPEQAYYDKVLPVTHEYLRLPADPAVRLEAPASSSSP